MIIRLLLPSALLSSPLLSSPLSVCLSVCPSVCLPALCFLHCMALCRNRLSEERKLWRKDHPYVRLALPPPPASFPRLTTPSPRASMPSLQRIPTDPSIFLNGRPE